MEFVNRGFNAAISIRQCATLKTWPEEMRVGMHLLHTDMGHCLIHRHVSAHTHAHPG
jgi:hypothetical protein